MKKGKEETKDIENKNKKLNAEWQFWVIIVLSIIVGIAIIACIVLCSNYNGSDAENRKGLWIAFLCAIISAGASLIVGTIAFWQNKRFREESNKKDELMVTENNKWRRQDLLIKTNPKSVFIRPHTIIFNREASVIISNNDSVNRLTEEHFEGIASFGKELHMDLTFEVNDNVDFICVTNLTMSQVDENFWPIRKQNFINASKNPYGELKVINNNKVNLFVQLLWDKLNARGEEENYSCKALDMLQNPNTTWSVTFEYEVGNNLSGNKNNYSTQFYFINESGDTNKYSFMEDVLDNKPLVIKILEDRTTTWMHKKETQNGQAKDDVNGQDK